MLNIGARRLRPADMDLPRNALALAYAPDGGRVAYTRIDHDGFQTLHIRNLRTGSEAQITPDLTNAFVPVWSPDGRWLAFSWSPVANAEIYVVDADPDRSPVADNPRPRRLTFNYNLDTYPAWSPDGRWIAFVSDRDGNTEIYVVDAARGEAAEDNDGGSVIRLTHDPARTLDPKWSPDGRWISYIAEHGGQRRLHMIATDCALAAEGECAPQIVPLTDSTHGNVWMAIWRPR
jgi:TolB protein